MGFFDERVLSSLRDSKPKDFIEAWLEIGTSVFNAIFPLFFKKKPT